MEIEYQQLKTLFDDLHKVLEAISGLDIIQITKLDEIKKILINSPDKISPKKLDNIANLLKSAEAAKKVSPGGGGGHSQAKTDQDLLDEAQTTNEILEKYMSKLLDVDQASCDTLDKLMAQTGMSVAELRKLHSDGAKELKNSINNIALQKHIDTDIKNVMKELNNLGKSSDANLKDLSDKITDGLKAKPNKQQTSSPSKSSGPNTNTNTNQNQSSSLRDANTKEVNRNTNAFNKLNETVMESAKAQNTVIEDWNKQTAERSNLEQSLFGKMTSNFMNLHHEIHGASTGFGAIGSVVSNLGMKIGAVAGLLGILEKRQQEYHTLADTGQVFNASMFTMVNEVNKAGYTIEDFSAIMAKGGAAALVGSENFLKIGKTVRSTMLEANNFGMSLKKLDEATSDYMDIVYNTGNIFDETAEKTASGMTRLLSAATGLSAALGKSREEVLKGMQATAQDENFRMATAGMTPEQTQALNAAAESGGGIKTDTGKLMFLKKLEEIDPEKASLMAANKEMTPESVFQAFNQLQGVKGTTKYDQDIEAAHKQAMSGATEKERTEGKEKEAALYDKQALENKALYGSHMQDQGNSALASGGVYQHGQQAIRLDLLRGTTTNEKALKEKEERDRQNIANQLKPADDSKFGQMDATMNAMKVALENGTNGLLQGISTDIGLIAPAIRKLAEGLTGITSTDAFQGGTAAIGEALGGAILIGSIAMLGKQLWNLIGVLKKITPFLQALARKAPGIPPATSSGGYSKPTLGGHTPGPTSPSGGFDRAAEAQMAKDGTILGKAQRMFGKLPGLIGKAAGPVGLLIAAGEALAGGVSGFQHADEILGKSKDKLTTMDKVSAGVGSAIGSILGTFDCVTESLFGFSIGPESSKVISKVLASVSEGIGGFVTGVADVLGEIFYPINVILTPVKALLGIVFSAGKSIVGELGDLLTGIGEVFKGLFEFAGGTLKILGGIIGIIMAPMKILMGDFDGVKKSLGLFTSGLSDVFGGLWDSLKGMLHIIETPFKAVLDMISNIGKWLKDSWAGQILAWGAKQVGIGGEAPVPAPAPGPGSATSGGPHVSSMAADFAPKPGEKTYHWDPNMSPEDKIQWRKDHPDAVRAAGDLSVAMGNDRGGLQVTQNGKETYNDQPGGKDSGGKLPQFGLGGWVGGSGSGDSVIAALTPGEFVMPPDPAKMFGPALEGMRSGRMVDGGGSGSRHITTKFDDMKKNEDIAQDAFMKGDLSFDNYAALPIGASLPKASPDLGERHSIGVPETGSGRQSGLAQPTPATQSTQGGGMNMAEMFLSSMGGGIAGGAMGGAMMGKMMKPLQSPAAGTVAKDSQALEKAALDFNKTGGQGFIKGAQNLIRSAKTAFINAKTAVKALPSVTSTMQSLSDAGKSIVDFSKGKASETIGKVSETFENIGPKIAKGSGELITKAGSIVPSMEQMKEGYKLASEKAENIGAKALKGGGEIASKIGEMTPSMKDITKAFGEISDGVSGTGSRILKSGGEIVGKAMEMLPSVGKIGEGFAKVGAAVLPLAGDVAKIGAKAIPGIGEIIMAGQAISDGIDGFNKAGDILGKSQKDLDFGDKLAAGMGSAVGGFVGIADDVTGLFGLDTHIGKDVTTNVSSALDSLKDGALSLFDGITGSVSDATKAVGKEAPGILSGIAGGLSSATDAVSNIGSSIVGGLSSIGSSLASGADRVFTGPSKEGAHQIAKSSDAQISASEQKLADNSDLGQMKKWIGGLFSNLPHFAGGGTVGGGSGGVDSVLAALTPGENIITPEQSEKLLGVFDGLMAGNKQMLTWMDAFSGQQPNADKFGKAMPTSAPMAPTTFDKHMAPLDKKGAAGMKMPEKGADSDMTVTLKSILSQQEKLNKLMERYVTHFSIYTNEWRDHSQLMTEITQNVSRYSERTTSGLRKLADNL